MSDSESNIPGSSKREFKNNPDPTSVKNDSDKSDNSDVGSVSVRLPNFWVNSPYTWFVQAEAQFVLHNVRSDRLRYHLIISALPQDMVETVIDVLQNPPDTNKYENLKQTLINRNSISEDVRLERLISDEQMGDRKPSDFYRHLKLLAGTSGIVTDALLTKLWLRRLPSVVNVALIPLADKNIVELSAIADRIWEASRQCVSVVQKPENSVNNELSDIRRDIQKLQKMFSDCLDGNQGNDSNFNLRGSSRPSFNFRNNSRTSSSTQNRNFNRVTNELCYFHKKFGNNARKCTPSCPQNKQFVEMNRLFPKNQ